MWQHHYHENVTSIDGHTLHKFQIPLEIHPYQNTFFNGTDEVVGSENTTNLVIVGEIEPLVGAKSDEVNCFSFNSIRFSVMVL